MSSTKKTTAALPDPASPKQKNPDRGRKNVEARLIKATCELLSRKGPRAVSIRDIAERAGVNHGQIHHYFGGKKGLISTAVRHMSQEHAEHVADRGLTKLDGPPPLTLGKDKTYVMSIIRLILDGELDLATLELED
jgi:AcrR family transcriptional regulator